MVQRSNELLVIHQYPTARHFIVHLTIKNQVDETKANGVFSEPELTRKDIVEEHNIILTTNKECSFKCVMCDLWKNTLDYSVKEGVILNQVKDALIQLPPAQHLKLYNAGSFFYYQSIHQFINQ